MTPIPTKEVRTTNTATLSLSECVIYPELIPDCVREDIGRVGLDAVIEFYKNAENEQRFQEWLTGKQNASQEGGT